MNNLVIKSYFFTFGSDPRFPFQYGWVEIEAPTKSAACNIFKAYFPDRVEGTLNCSFVYGEEFKATGMFKGEYPEDFCHVKIRYLNENNITEEKDG